MKKLPLDISSFAEMRKLNYVYIDKTKYAYDLITGGRRFFLARPRRFGKSLFVSMLKEVLKGNRNVFQGLWIANSDYTWKPHGVIVLDFSGLGIHDAASFNKGICLELRRIAHSYKLSLTLDMCSPESAIKDLVIALNEQFGTVAILVDEYDSAILHSLHNIENALEIRDAARRFFATIKSLDEKINFVFITGISSFAKAGLFSGMNNLQTITFNTQYAGICGYTEHELHENFKDYIQSWATVQHKSYDMLSTEIKKWYNGYRFSKSNMTIYNPFSIMHALAAQEFKNFWFLSGTPSFLVKLMKKEYTTLDIATFGEFEMSEDALGVIDVNAMPLVVILYQAGYLTIVDYDPDGHYYKLDFPNAEVKISFQKYLLEAILHVDASHIETLARRFKVALQKNNLSELTEALLQLFSHVPYQLHMKEEKYYHSLMIMLCIASGIEVNSEYSTSDGRIDLVLHLQKIIYVIEIKFNKPAAQAIAQIKERAYYKPFLASDKEMILLGMSFLREPQKFDIEIEQEKLNVKI